MDVYQVLQTNCSTLTCLVTKSVFETEEAIKQALRWNRTVSQNGVSPTDWRERLHRLCYTCLLIHRHTKELMTQCDKQYLPAVILTNRVPSDTFIYSSRLLNVSLCFEYDNGIQLYVVLQRYQNDSFDNLCRVLIRAQTCSCRLPSAVVVTVLIPPSDNDTVNVSLPSPPSTRPVSPPSQSSVAPQDWTPPSPRRLIEYRGSSPRLDSRV